MVDHYDHQRLEMVKSPNGNWVRASDYDALSAKLKKYGTHIRKLETLLREWRDVQCDQVMPLQFMRRVDAALASQSDASADAS